MYIFDCCVYYCCFVVFEDGLYMSLSAIFCPTWRPLLMHIARTFLQTSKKLTAKLLKQNTVDFIIRQIKVSNGANMRYQYCYSCSKWLKYGVMAQSYLLCGAYVSWSLIKGLFVEYCGRECVNILRNCYKNEVLFLFQFFQLVRSGRVVVVVILNQLFKIRASFITRYELVFFWRFVDQI